MYSKHFDVVEYLESYMAL